MMRHFQVPVTMQELYMVNFHQRHLAFHPHCKITIPLLLPLSVAPMMLILHTHHLTYRLIRYVMHRGYERLYNRVWTSPQGSASNTDQHNVMSLSLIVHKMTWHHKATVSSLHCPLMALFFALPSGGSLCRVGKFAAWRYIPAYYQVVFTGKYCRAVNSLRQEKVP